jgi:hypothetical protein
MPSLTRRRSNDIPQDSWRIFYGDVPVGWIGIRSGVPVNVAQWGWRCGFYPGMEPGQHRDGSANTFRSARAAFLFAWRQVLPHLGEANFEAYRREHAFHKWRRRMWDEGLKMPTQLASGQSKCFCGAAINLENTEQHVYEKHMDLK